MKLLTIGKLPDLEFDAQEAINQLRVNLGFTGSNIQTIMITSSIPNEGKSFISLNLWRSFASVGKKVLLIDADLRLSQMRTEFDFQVSDSFVGLAYLLSGQSMLSEVIYKTNVENGYILPVTNLVTDPSLLLSQSSFKELIDACKENFDVIIVDSPPVCSVFDPLVISEACDGSVLVVRAGMTKKRLVNESFNALKRAGSHVLGICLNDVNTTRTGSYYYSGYNSEYYKAPKKKTTQNKKRKKAEPKR